MCNILTQTYFRLVSGLFVSSLNRDLIQDFFLGVGNERWDMYSNNTSEQFIVIRHYVTLLQWTKVADDFAESDYQSLFRKIQRASISMEIEHIFQLNWRGSYEKDKRNKNHDYNENDVEQNYGEETEIKNHENDNSHDDDDDDDDDDSDHSVSLIFVGAPVSASNTKNVSSMVFERCTSFQIFQNEYVAVILTINELVIEEGTKRCDSLLAGLCFGKDEQIIKARSAVRCDTCDVVSKSQLLNITRFNSGRTHIYLYNGDPSERTVDTEQLRNLTLGSKKL
ncbi:hypothetical protein PV325_005551 [Microctonus aethiopoides]|nr:hypothetical protein PV325_005551 [Microctonus aethiopoides]